MFQFAVIPGAAKRRPGIQSAAETLWIPAFAGMTKKTRSSRFKLLKMPPVSCMCKDQPEGRGNNGLFVQALTHEYEKNNAIRLILGDQES